MKFQKQNTYKKNHEKYRQRCNEPKDIHYETGENKMNTAGQNEGTI